MPHQNLLTSADFDAQKEVSYLEANVMPAYILTQFRTKSSPAKPTRTNPETVPQYISSDSSLD